MSAPILDSDTTIAIFSFLGGILGGVVKNLVMALGGRVAGKLGK